MWHVLYNIKRVMEALSRKYGELLRNREQRAREMKKGEQFSETFSDNGQPRKDNNCMDCLDVVECEAGGSGKRENLHELYSYRVDGQTSILYVSDLYLQQRAKGLKEKADGKDGNAQIMQAEEEEQKGERKSVRYFDGFKKEEGMRYARCYRCGKPGHSIKHCIFQQEPIKCMFCLGNHSHNSCNTRTCFQCNQMGHIAKECKNSNRLRCKKCGNKGHIQANCGSIVFLNHSKGKPQYSFREKYGFEDMLNLRCLAYCQYPVGHFNCHKYLNDKQQCYSQAKAEKTIQREKFILSNFNKLREIYYKQQQNKPSKSTLKPTLQPSQPQKMQQEIQCSQ